MAARERRRGAPVFWILLLLFAVLLAVFWAFVVRYVTDCMVTFEAAQPEHLADQLVEQLKSGALLDRMTFESSPFEAPDAAREAYESKLSGGKYTWRKAGESYDKTPVYQLCVAGQPVAVATLREKSSQVLMFLLTLQEWEVDSVVPMVEAGSAWTVVAPDSYTVTVNGIPLGEEQRTGEQYVPDQFQYVAAYVEPPALVEYKVEGLYHTPEIQVLDQQGQALHPVTDGRRVSVTSFVPSEMDPELKDYVLQNAKDYSNFFSADLAGATASTKPIRHMFPEGSYYLELAENYRKHDMWMYASHKAPVFSQERVTNYIRYTDDLFSCDVSFDKKMTLTSTGQDRHDQTNTRYFYVDIDGQWLIADMQQILGSQPAN